MSDRDPSSHGSELELTDTDRGKRKRETDEAKSEDNLEGGGVDSQLSMQSIDEEFICSTCIVL